MPNSALIHDLTDSAPPRLKRGLIEAHRKLSDYYYKSDASPYYLLAALLDPRIGYESLRRDFADEPDLLDSVDASVRHVRTRLDTLYPGKTTAPVVSIPAPPMASSSRVHFRTSPQKPNFTRLYQQFGRQPVDEIDTFIKLAQEDFENCDPIAWCSRDFIGLHETFWQYRRLSAETISTLMIVKQHLKSARTAIDELAAM
ncbi:hypothetical protein B0H17DRAFT_1134739 [Mycena rosella]|uniref:Uncharacterized protein n=1 Tax=Mycena rosella TaxID=1033263 RepID=A0AAD7DEI1_MYCRO|nr:hypothetical protein B0H17DRAFT_1134739 [Mycena rosella]